MSHPDRRTPESETSPGESRELLANILHSAMDAIVTVDERQRIVLFNRAAEAVFRCPAAEAVGGPLERFIPERFREAHLRHLPRFGESDTTGRRMGRLPVLDGLRADGEEFPFEASISAVEVGGRKLYTAILRDITGRRRAEEALRESEKKFRATFEQAAVGIAHVALDGRWLRVNRKLCDIVGYIREELLGLSFQEITHPEDLDADLEQAARLHGGEIETYSMEKRYVRKGGSTVWINLTGSLVRDEATGAPLYFIAVVEEIGARKRAEAALRESEEGERLRAGELQSILDAVPAGVWIARDPQCLRIVGNRESYRMLRLPEGSNESKSAPGGERPANFRVLREDGSEYEPEELPQQRAGATGLPQRGTRLELLFEDGRRRTIYGNAEPLFDPEGRTRGAVSAFIDITEVVRAEEATRESREMFARAFAASPDPLAISRVSDGLIIEVNESWDSLFGVGREEAVGRSSLDLGLFVNPGDRERAIAILRREGRVRDFEMAVNGSAGERLTLLSVEPITVRGEECLLTIIRDITERKRAELALHRLAEGFATAREEVRRAIARELHDDASQNLSAVAVRLKLLESRLSTGRVGAAEACDDLARLRETLEETQRNLRRMAHSLHPATLEHFGLAEALRAFAREEAEASGVRVTLDAPDSFPRLAPAVEVSLYRLAQEAVANALKHSGAGSVFIGVGLDEGVVSVSVEDDGRGFDPKSSGPGLGLVSMRERAEIIGGRLEVDSRPGVGTAVTVSAPARPPDADGETLVLSLPRRDAPVGGSGQGA